MHILYIHQHFSTPKGAAGTRSYEFAKKLVAAGHQVTMICGKSQMANTGTEGQLSKGVRTSYVEGFQVLEIDIPYSNHDSFFTRTKKFIAFAYRVCRLALSLDYDVIFTTTTPLTVGIPGILAKWFRRKVFIFEVRDLWPELPKAMGVIKSPVVLWLMHILERRSYKAADALIGLSPGIVEGIKRIVPKKQVAMIPNGCDEIFDIVAEKKVLPGFSDNDFVAVFTGAHGVANGLDAVLDAAVELKKQKNQRVKLLFIGDGKLKPQLQARARQQNLDNCVFWDPIPKLELAKLLQSVDAGLMVLQNVPAFYYGTSPNKFFDYLAAGLPVINNYPGWLAELIKKHECGLVVQPDDPKAFADALVSLSRNPNSLAKMKGNAKELAKTFDRDFLATEFVTFMESVYEKSV